MNVDTRHESVRQVVRYFQYEHLTDKKLRNISKLCSELVEDILDAIPRDNPELTVGLRKLLEAKDCFVRAAL